MPTYTTPGSPLTMTALAAWLDAAFGAAVTLNRGASAPTGTDLKEGMLWWDTSGGATAEVLKRYTVAGGWVSLMTVNITAGSIVGLSALLDEDDMASDSAVLPPSQQSALAYFMAKTGANLAIGSDADGDMYYRASSVLARLAKGAANTHLIMNAGATAPEWAAGVKIGASSRTGDAASGDVAYTGVGFKPSNILFFGAYSGGTPMCIGLDDATIHRGVFDNYQNNNNAWGAVNYCLNFAISPGTYQQAIVKTLDEDGFTLTWTKTGSPAAAACTFYYICFR